MQLLCFKNRLAVAMLKFKEILVQLLLQLLIKLVVYSRNYFSIRNEIIL